jgi:hypothetical protein
VFTQRGERRAELSLRGVRVRPRGPTCTLGAISCFKLECLFLDGRAQICGKASHRFQDVRAPIHLDQGKNVRRCKIYLPLLYLYLPTWSILLIFLGRNFWTKHRQFRKKMVSMFKCSLIQRNLFAKVDKKFGNFCTNMKPKVFTNCYIMTKNEISTIYP